MDVPEKMRLHSPQRSVLYFSSAAVINGCAMTENKKAKVGTFAFLVPKWIQN
jgi:type IV pilus biogenesis protein CpaD/CtpE